jgi:2-haloacid dehalogenase
MGNLLNTAETQNSVPLRGVRDSVFDAYGTLSDFAAARRKCPDVFGDNVERLTTLWRDKQLQYTWRDQVFDRTRGFGWGLKICRA